jgi:hypothetical protein
LEISELVIIFAFVKKEHMIMSTTTLYSLRDYLYGTMSADEMMWLVEELTNYIRKGDDIQSYTIEELDSRIDKSERDAIEGRYRTHEELFASIMN